MNILDSLKPSELCDESTPRGNARSTAIHSATVTAATALATARAAMRPRSAPEPPFSGENCTIVLTDVVGYGAYERNDRDRRTIRGAHQNMMQAALGDMWKKERTRDRGDGLLVVVPPHFPTIAVMERLHRTLPEELRRHNGAHDAPVCFQLRIAVHVGPVTTDEVGWSGEVIIRTARLLEAPVLKEAMAATGASLGVIVSMFVYETVIRHADEWADQDSYNEVEAHVKESRVPAWMQLIDPAQPAA